MKTSYEPVLCVVSENMENHRIAEFRVRPVYKYKDGREKMNFMDHRREIIRTKFGLAVFHLDWKSVKITRLPEIIDTIRNL